MVIGEVYKMKERLSKVKKTKRFLIVNKKKVIIGVSFVVTGMFAYIFYKKNSSNPYRKYNNNFFRNATDEELRFEREQVRLKYANAGLSNMSDKEFDYLYFLLKKFDNVMSQRAWNGRTPRASVSNEHGRYLPSDD